MKGSKNMEHQIEKTASGVRCLVCEKTWKQKPRYGCPGVKWYERGTAPEHLMTIGQLKKRRLKPGAPHRAVVGGVGQWYLFDVAEAIQFTAEEIAAVKEKARQARYCYCRHCEQDVRKEKFDSYWDACLTCLPEVLKKEREAVRREEEAAKAEHQALLIKDRDNAILWARSILTRSDWVILDTETTGLDWDAEIVSVSVVAPDGAILLDTLVKPQKSIPPEATAVNHINDEMVSVAPTFDDVFLKLCAVLEEKLIIAYNVDFDRRLINQTCRRYGLPVEQIASDWECAMLTYAKYVGEWRNYFGSYRWQALPKGDHTAGGDCLATLELIQRMAASTEDVPESIKIA